MKKQFFISSALLFANFCFSQNTFPTAAGTNVGIGTLTPSEKLEVVGKIKASKLDLGGTPSNGYVFSNEDDRFQKSIVLNFGSLVSGSSTFRTFKFFDFPQSNFDAKSSVYFGIEDRNDMGRYRFFAEASGSTEMSVHDKSQENLFSLNDDGNNNVYLQLPKPNSRIVIGDLGTYLPQHKLVVRGSSKIEGNILTDANVGIGTSSFSDGTDTYRLSVDGAVRAHRVKVYTTWADFVFEDNYKLPTLMEVEKHIKQNGHLKDIPSAKQVEENGIELGEMNKLLLQKVEELTLYLIEMDKEIKDLKCQIKNN